MNVFDTQKIAAGWVFGDQSYFGPPVMQGALEPFDVGATRFSIGWQAAVASIGAIAGYEIRINGGAYIRVGLAESYRFTWVAPASVHAVAVRAIDTSLRYSVPLTLDVTTLAYPDTAIRQVLINGRIGMDPADAALVVMIPRQ